MSPFCRLRQYFVLCLENPSRWMILSLCASLHWTQRWVEWPCLHARYFSLKIFRQVFRFVNYIWCCGVVKPGLIIIFQIVKCENAFSNLKGNSNWKHLSIALSGREREWKSTHPQTDDPCLYLCCLSLGNHTPAQCSIWVDAEMAKWLQNTMHA